MILLILQLLQINREKYIKREPTGPKSGSRLSGWLKKYRNGLPVIPFYVHRLNILANVLLSVRMIDPHGVNGVFPFLFSISLSNNCTTILMIASSVCIYQWLTVSYVFVGPVPRWVKQFLVCDCALFAVVGNLSVVWMGIYEKNWTWAIHTIFIGFLLASIVVTMIVASMRLHKRLNDTSSSVTNSKNEIRNGRNTALKKARKLTVRAGLVCAVASALSFWQGFPNVR